MASFTEAPLRPRACAVRGRSVGRSQHPNYGQFSRSEIFCLNVTERRAARRLRSGCYYIDNNGGGGECDTCLKVVELGPHVLELGLQVSRLGLPFLELRSDGGEGGLEREERKAQMNQKWKTIPPRRPSTFGLPCLYAKNEELCVYDRESVAGNLSKTANGVAQACVAM